MFTTNQLELMELTEEQRRLKEDKSSCSKVLNEDDLDD